MTTAPSSDLATAPERPLHALGARYRTYRGRFVAAVTASTVNKVADVAPELLIGAAVDVVVRGDGSFVADLLGVDSRYTQLAVLAAINVVIWVVESISEYVAAVLWRGLAQGIEHDLRVEAYDHVQHLDLSWHEARPSGTTLATLNDDVNQLERFLDVGAPTILQTALNILLVGAVFAASSWTLLVLAFLPIPLIVIGSLVFQRRLEPLYDRVRASVGDLSSALSANLAGLTTIKAFTAEDRERDRIAAASLAYRRANTDAIRSSAAFVPAGAHGDPGRLHLHPAARRLDDPRRRPRGRALLRAGLHDPAAAVAADRGGGGARPLPARSRLGGPHPRPAGGPGHRARR